MIATIIPNEVAQLICLAAAVLLVLGLELKIHPRLLRKHLACLPSGKAGGGREGAKSAKFYNIFFGASRTKKLSLPQRPSLLPGYERTVKILQSALIIITRDIDFKNESVVIIDSGRTVKKLQSEELSRSPPKV